MELEGTLDFERPRTRRWIPIVAVAIPVVVFVLSAAWFIRAFVAPPMISIPAPMALAAGPQPAQPARVPASAPASVAAKDVAAVVEMPAAAAPPMTPNANPTSTPLFASLSRAPSPFPPVPRVNAATPETTASAFPQPPALQPPAPQPVLSPPPASPPVSSPPPAAQPFSMQALAAAPPSTELSNPPSAEAVEGGTPIAGPIPLPRHKPRVSVALAGSAVPLPRPRPTDAEQPAADQPAIPTFDRHAVE